MKKEFTKQNLQTGDIVVLRNGEIGVVLLEKEIILFQNSGFEFLDMYTDELLDTDGYRDGDIMEVYGGNGIVGFNDYKDSWPVYEREDDGLGRGNLESFKKSLAEKEARQKKELEEINAARREENHDSITIVAQALYGNRTETEIRPEQMDRIILGYLSDFETRPDGNGKYIRVPLVITEPVDRTIIRIPDAENLVLVYNNYQEEERLKDVKEYKAEGYQLKPLATIPELGIVLYSRCIVCRMNEDGVFESLQKEDYAKFMKYLAE